MTQIRTLLDSDEKRGFGIMLLRLVEERIADVATAAQQQALRREFCDALSQTSLSRLRAYAEGTYFPTPRVLRRLASVLEVSAIPLLTRAGYVQEAIVLIHGFYVLGREPSRLDHQNLAIEYAIRLFPLRGERYRHDREPWGKYSGSALEFLASDYYERMEDQVDRRVPLARSLQQARDILNEGSITVQSRRAIAGELVRVWAYSVNATFAQSTERKTYLDTPAVGAHPVPLLPIPTDLFTRLVNKRKS